MNRQLTMWGAAIANILTQHATRRADVSKHAKQTRKPRNWRQHRKNRRKIAKQSRRRNRQ